MSVDTKSCRDCGAECVWVESVAGHWYLYELRPVPFVNEREGVVLNSQRGWVDAASAWPEPAEMLPRHWHRKRDKREPRHVSDVLDAFLTDYPRQRPSRKPRRSARA